MRGTGRLLAACALLALSSCNRGPPTPAATPSPAPARILEATASETPPPPPQPAPTPSPSRPPLLAPVPPTSAPPDASSPPLLPPVPTEIAAPVALPTVAVPAETPLPPMIPPRPAVPEQNYAPRDECARLPGWPAFHAKLAAAVAAKDVHTVVGLAASSIKLDYAGGEGRHELRMRLTDPKRGLWRELRAILPLGCAVADGIVAMPWYFWNLPPDTNGTDALLVTGAAVPLRARPAADARTLATLDWAIVKLPNGKFDPKAKFTAVRTRAGKVDGYVETAKLRNLLDYRLIAEKKGGKWRLTAFTSGG